MKRNIKAKLRPGTLSRGPGIRVYDALNSAELEGVPFIVESVKEQTLVKRVRTEEGFEILRFKPRVWDGPREYNVWSETLTLSPFKTKRPLEAAMNLAELKHLPKFSKTT